MLFVSEENRKMHEEYLRKLKLEYSIYEKSYPSLLGKSPNEILRLRALSRSEREAAALKKGEILAHELYFNSYGEKNSPSAKIREAYGSEANFLYELSQRCMSTDGGFILVCRDSRGKIAVLYGTEFYSMFSDFSPLLAVDLCEHAYFYDYGFNKKSYINSALMHLALERI